MVATLRKADGSTLTLEGAGNGPIDAFVDALKRGFSLEFSFLDYHEHAVGRGANATAACYVEIQDSSGQVLHGVGIDPSIVTASLKATLSAVMRLMGQGGRGLGPT
jgi:2-isopropylmalate synthase